ncbi:MAG: sigma 54-interacting transcriptional regulator [Alphaproteobacteria bacterium]|uniref:HTH-type transcriptional regulatory protein TyrR n=1 Tax=Candidatus Nitrobium versatile TaxID=2884831 RepID=A0A953J9Z1_9BACT|nr:sigma 54-interacting transcriptional regulator [Candidatus Nitrobium versatile]
MFPGSISLSDLVASASVGIVATDPRDIIIMMNSKAETLLNIERENVIGRTLSALPCYEEVSQHLNKCNKAVLHKSVDQKLLIAKGPLLSGGKMKGTLYFLQDFSAAEVQGGLQYCNLEVLIDGSHDGIILTDHEKIIKVNSSFLRISGLRKEYAEGKPIAQLADNPHVCLKSIYEVSDMARQQKKSVTIMRTMHQGNEIYVTGTPIKCDCGVEHVAVNIRDVTELQHLKEQVSRLTALYLSTAKENQLDKIIGGDVVVESPVMKRVLDLTLRIAKVDSVVLILGESGTGKEVFAKLIHSLSSRSNGPFISINCGAIPENLLESELFGYEKGSFSGAGKDGKPGLFELANGGVIFLDEIGEMPLSLQVKLLKVLQDMKAYRLGGVKPVKFDVRVVAATNRNLLDLVREEKFREDLFYRLYVVPIEVPPLRERREDIFPLSWHFLKMYNQKYKQSKTISSELIEILEAYNWPGNVRELQNIIERLIVTSDSEVLRPEHLPRSMSLQGAEDLLEKKEGSEIPSLTSAKEQVERSMLAQAVEMKRTTREIAHMLGVDHSTVVRKLQKYGLSEGKRHRSRRTERHA